MIKPILKNKFYMYDEKVYMLIATNVNVKYNLEEKYLVVDSFAGFTFCIPLKTLPLFTVGDLCVNLYIDLQNANIVTVDAEFDYILRDAKEGNYISLFNNCYSNKSLPIYILEEYSNDERFTIFVDYLDALFSRQYCGTINNFIEYNGALNEFDSTVKVGSKVYITGRQDLLTVLNTTGTSVSFEEISGMFSICDVRSIVYNN